MNAGASTQPHECAPGLIAVSGALGTTYRATSTNLI
jgi:hypothetical protein